MVTKDGDFLASGDELEAAARGISKMFSDGADRTALKRGFRMGKLGFGLAGSYIGYQLQNLFLGESRRIEQRKLFHALAALQVREELQSLKGPIMKLGQTLSMQSQVLPEEVVNELANLQMRAPAMHPTLARAQFKGAYGKFPEEVFREFAPEPFAAASLGQVHRAVTRAGEQVAVKIQYPAIRSAIENDFKLLRSVSLPARLSKFGSEAVISELEQGILKETDYLNEGKNIDFFREHLKPLPYVEVPKVFWELTTDRVLTMSCVSGQPMSDFLLINQPTQQTRNEIGSRLMALFSYQVRRIHAIHADPHPGNYLINPGGRIGLVDFGCVKRFSPDFVELVRAFEQPDWHASKDQARRVARLIWGLKISRQPRVARKLLDETKDFHDTTFGARAPVDFGDPGVLRKLVHLWSESIRNKAVNPEFAFYGRAEIGLYNVLHQLRARIDTASALTNLENPTRHGSDA
jgi:predicted unusual protein kinase regulating ubiquinone biosynthesis (AarF/ABC1/UbiB family)